MNGYCKDITGKRNGKLTAISFSHSKNHKAYWLCRCDCGIEKILEARRITIPKYKSCGQCPKREIKPIKSKLVKDNLYYIRKWIKRNLLRKNLLIFQSRKFLKVEDVVHLCLEAQVKFPYISFQGGRKEFWASFDRIDSSRDYSDIKNIKIIPFWLNAAKMQLTYEELQKLMKDYLNDNI